MARGNEPDWVEVASVGQDDEATLIAGLLESEGIPSEVEGPSMTPFPDDLGAFGASRVMVPPDRAAEAKELIASMRREHEARRGSPESAEESEE